MSLNNSTASCMMKIQHDETETGTDKNETDNTEEMIEITEITTDELQKAIKRLKKGDAVDSNGIRTRTEDIRACAEETKEMVEQIFNDIVKQNEITLGAWRRVRRKRFLKIDMENVKNYQPICSLPALYKLFTTILYSNLYPRLEEIFQRPESHSTDRRRK